MKYIIEIEEYESKYEVSNKRPYNSYNDSKCKIIAAGSYYTLNESLDFINRQIIDDNELYWIDEKDIAEEIAEEDMKCIDVIDAENMPIMGGYGNYVYIVEAESTNRVKIGFSKNPERRIKDLNGGSPVALHLLCLLKVASPSAEKLLHRLFEKDRIKGEWFRKSDQIMHLIEIIKSNRLKRNKKHSVKEMRSIARVIREEMQLDV